MIQQTSVLAYETAKERLGEKQQIVYKAIKANPDISNGELAHVLGWPINSVTPRVFELTDMMLVTEACRRKDKHTGRTVIAWKAAFTLAYSV
jgi:hypothetical protein